MPRMNLRQRIDVIKWYYQNDFISDILILWRAKYDEPPPTRLSVTKLVRKFETTGTVDNRCKGNSGRHRTTRTIANAAEVHNVLLDEPTTSQRQVARCTGIPLTSVNQIIKDIGMKPYRPRLVHALNEDDPDRRIQYCEELLDFFGEDRTNVLRILYTDEAKFHLNGRVNRHNCVYYDDENPHAIVEGAMMSPGVNVWAGIWAGGIIGPFFLDGNINGQVYLQLLQEKVFPEVLVKCPADIIFQQDGAPSHYAVAVREVIDDQFPDSWIGRRGPMEWPARSCDLTPMDFGVWGMVRDKVYVEPSPDIRTLKVLIEEAFETFSPALCREICSSVEDRCGECIVAGGGQFEHLRA